MTTQVERTGGASGIGMILLTIAFFTAKVLGYISWPWIWVFAPLWLPFTIVIGLGLIFVALWLIYTGINYWTISNRDARRVRRRNF